MRSKWRFFLMIKFWRGKSEGFFHDGMFRKFVYASLGTSTFRSNLVDLHFSEFSYFCADRELGLRALDRRKNRKNPNKNIGRPHFVRELVTKFDAFEESVADFRTGLFCVGLKI